MLLSVKNMVCARCVRAVDRVLRQAGYPVRAVELGTVEVEGTLTPTDEARIDAALREEGFELLVDRDRQLVEQVKSTLIRYLSLIESGEKVPSMSRMLGDSIHMSYAALGKLFHSHEGLTIEAWFIRLRIERAKELLQQGATALEAALTLGYSSGQYLGTQFKQVTGLTITEWKNSERPRTALDQV